VAKKLLKFVGQTEDGKVVVAGVYRYCETTGVPLSDMLTAFQDRNAVTDWLSYCAEALIAGMDYERVVSRISEATVDAFDSEHRDIVLSKLEHIVSQYGKVVFLIWYRKVVP